MGAFKKSTLNLCCFMLIYFLLCTLSFAKEKSAEQYLRENERLAEKNPQSYIKRPYAGANIKINANNKLEVDDVLEGSPADKSGITKGDIVISIDGIKINDKYKAYEYFNNKKPGDSITVSIKKGTKIIKKRIKLGTSYELLIGVILEELIYKNKPIRLAIIDDEPKIYSVLSDPHIKQTIDSYINSMGKYVTGSMESAFLKSSRSHTNFTLIDRRQIASVIDEQKFIKSGLVSSDYQSQLGKILSATHLFFMNVVYYVNKTDFNYIVTMRLTDVETGKVLGASTIRDSKPYREQSSIMAKQDMINYSASLSKFTNTSKEAMEAYAKGLEFTDTSMKYDTLVQTVIPKYEIFLEKLRNINPLTDEIKNLHKICVELANLRLAAFYSYKSGFENKDRALLTEGDSKMKMSNDKAREYTDSFNSLLIKYDLNK